MNDTGPCLPPAELEAIASGGGTPQALAHVATCQNCGVRIADLRDEGQFLARVRGLAGSHPATADAPVIPGYRTTGLLSAGAQGVVFRGVQETTQRPVAIKTLALGQSASARHRARAEREAEIAARLRHPNIVSVFESRTLWDGRTAVVMEFVDGVPIDQWTPPGETPDARRAAILRVFAEVCSGIHHAHLNGVIHRDLKPDNILVTPDSRPVILDFGIAKAGGIHTTVTGEFAGTPAFASPEQVSGHPEHVDALTDVYSLGVVLYRLVCGQLPYEVGETIFDVARVISETPPTPPKALDPTIPSDLQAVILKALKKNKSDRYQSAAALAIDVGRTLAGEPVEARADSGWYLLRKAVAVNRSRLAWIAATVLALASALAIIAVAESRARESALLAERRQAQARAEGVRARAVTEFLREALPYADPSRPETNAAVVSGLRRLYFRLETGAFAGDPEVDQTLRRLWGSVYSGFGEAKATGLIEYAEVSLRNGLMRLRAQHGDEHEDVASTMQQLAWVMLGRKRYAEAEDLCRRTLAMRERLVGERSSPAAESRALLARVLVERGRTDKGLAEADRTLDVLRDTPPEDADLLHAGLLTLKARVLLSQNAYTDADPLVREALRLRLRHLPPEDPDVLASLRQAIETAEAQPSTQIARILREAWPDGTNIREDLPLIARIDRDNLPAGTQIGRTAAMGRLFSLAERMLGSNDVALVRILTSRIRAAEAEWDQAARLQCALRAAELMRSNFGPDHPWVLVFHEEAASMLAFQGDARGAVEHARKAAKIRDRIPEPARDHIMFGNAERNLAWFLALDGQYEASLASYERALAILTNVVGPEQHLVALSELGMAFCSSQLGRTDDAARLIEIAWTKLSRMPQLFPDQRAHARFVRGHVLAKLGRTAEGEKELRGAWDDMYKQFDPAFGWRRVLAEDLVSIARDRGDAQEAAAWEARKEQPRAR